MGVRQALERFSIVMSALALGTNTHAASLRLEDRIAAQRTMERVYYAHQLQSSRSFEDAVPAKVIRAKAIRGLELTVALERYWKVTVTSEMLDAEIDRMVRHTRMPERLQELFDALGDDSTLIRECLARPVLADRLARNAFAAMPPAFGKKMASWDAWWSDVEPTLAAAAAKVAVPSGGSTPGVRAPET